ncbi:hypothetical protein D9M72_618110 [compost metagenome]
MTREHEAPGASHEDSNLAGRDLPGRQPAEPGTNVETHRTEGPGVGKPAWPLCHARSDHQFRNCHDQHLAKCQRRCDRRDLFDADPTVDHQATVLCVADRQERR